MKNIFANYVITQQIVWTIGKNISTHTNIIAEKTENMNVFVEKNTFTHKVYHDTKFTVMLFNHKQ